MEQEIVNTLWDSALLENLTEDNFINNIHQRYKHDNIYTYIGTSVVSVNPYHQISTHSLENVHQYGTKGIFQLPPHIYGLSNLAFQSLKDQNMDQCIILTGESGSGKTESFKMIVNFLTHIQDAPKVNVANPRLGSAIRSTSSLSHYHVRRPSPTNNVVSSNLSCSTHHQTHRRASSGCSATNVGVCKTPVVGCASTPTPRRHQSPSPGPVARRCESAVIMQRTSHGGNSERNQQCSRNVHEKAVTLNITRHKSSENVSFYLDQSKEASGGGAGSSSSVHGYPTHSISGANSHKNLSQKPQPHQKSLKSCTKHQMQSASNVTALKGNVGSMGNISPKYVHVNAAAGCRTCGHSRCTRAQSLEKEDRELLQQSAHEKTKHLSAFEHRGSCSNIVRQQSTESQTEHSTMGDCSSRRISLYDAHKLNLEAAASETSSSRGAFANLVYTSPSASLRRKHKTPAQKLRECVTCADVFLEAMGNAATMRNNNSSRYGKLFDIEINFKGDPIGVHITHFMLEKSRITNTLFGERNFHIFYQLLSGADLQLLKSLKLYRNVEKYEILKNTTANEEDRANFYYTKKSLYVLNLSCDEITAILRILAVVLKLGNLVFVPVTNIDGTEGCQISNIYELQEIAYLLNIEAQILINCLTRATSSNDSHEDVGFDLDAKQASSVRNTLCRTLYSRLFTWLVNKINEKLKSTQREKNLALLDFYGFEVLERNSFEQLAINYSAEKIHQNFVHNVLKVEQDLYIREGLEWSRIDFFDNESICELIDKPSYGILSLMNEPHLQSDEALFMRIQQCCAGHTNFVTNGPKSMSFKIRHFANVVNYSVHRFLEKNTDVLPKYVSAGLYKSKLILVQSLFPEGNPRRQAMKKPTTLSSNIRTQLQTLLEIIKHRRSHYVFCIKPNDCKKSHSFDLALVQHQVRYMSLMSLVHLCRTGHCFHLTHAKFLNRYKLLNSKTWPHFRGGSQVEGIALIIRSLPLPSAEFTIGSKNVFVRSPRTVYELEQFRKNRINELAILIQKTFRMFIARRRYQRMRNSQIVISSAWRTWRECRFGIPSMGRSFLWSLYRVAREEYRSARYRRQANWAVDVISRYYRRYKIRQYLLTIPLRLPPNTLSPLSTDWPNAPKFLLETSRLLRSIYHRWKCLIYRNSFDQTSRNRMREKVTASIIFKDRKASYARSVSHPFVGDYVRLRHNQQWKRMCVETNDQYVVFADIINKITRSSGKSVPILLVLSTSSLLLLDQRTLQIKYRVPASEIYRMSLSPYIDDIAVFHVKASELGRKKGDFVFQTGHVIEIVTKMFLVIQNATGKPPEIHISTEFEANFGQQTVVFSFKYTGMSELAQGGQGAKITRKGNRMEIIV